MTLSLIMINEVRNITVNYRELAFTNIYGRGNQWEHTCVCAEPVHETIVTSMRAPFVALIAYPDSLLKGSMIQARNNEGN